MSRSGGPARIPPGIIPDPRARRRGRVVVLYRRRSSVARRLGEGAIAFVGVVFVLGLVAWGTTEMQSQPTWVAVAIAAVTTGVVAALIQRWIGGKGQ